jgi:hypothetical protein
MKDARYPYVLNTDLDISYERWEDMYEDWNGRSILSAINWLQTTSDKIDDYKKTPIDVSFALIKEMNLICKRNNTKFLLALLDENDDSKALKKMLSTHAIDYVDVNFDFQNPKLTNYPYDNHPNNLGHELIANKINSRINQFSRDD